MSLLIMNLAALGTALSQTAPDKPQTFDYDQVVQCYFVYDTMSDEALERDDIAWTKKFVTAVEMTVAIAKGVGKAKNLTEAQVTADLKAAYDKYIGQYPNLGSKIVESGRCDRALGIDTRKPRPAG